MKGTCLSPKFRITLLTINLSCSRSKDFRQLTFSSKSYFENLLSLHVSQDLHPLLREVAEADPGAWLTELMAGFVTSADTGNEDLVIASRAALSNFCEASHDNLNLTCQALLQNLKSRQGQDRVVVPVLEIVAFLFHVGLFQDSSIDLRSLCLQTQKAGYKTGNLRKLEACVKVYSGVALTDGQDGREAGVLEARKRLGALLYHPWPKVRTMVVDALWGLLGDETGEGEGERLKGIDWGQVTKPQVKEVVEGLRLV